MKNIISGLLMILLLPAEALANYGRMMGGKEMMWGWHGGGLGLVVHGLYSLFCLALLVLFFWLLIRITRALESIAQSKKEE